MEMQMATTSRELLARWDAAARRGVLRSTLDAAQWRVLPGSLGLLVLFNPQHRIAKRPVAAELNQSTTAPVTSNNSNAFNFAKAKPEEFLCGLRVGGSEAEGFSTEDVAPSDDWQPPQHAVLVNVSPLMHGHLLCVFDLPALHPQKLTLNLLRLALGVGPLIARDDFYLGFNSAGAWSSVNHCHFQGYWMNEVAQSLGDAIPGRFPVTNQDRQPLLRVTVEDKEVQISRVKNWPMGCIAIEAVDDEKRAASRSSGIAGLASCTWKLIQLLHRSHVPHNLLITWHPRPVVFVFPRKPQQENGVGRFTCTQQLRFAVAEVAGLVVAGHETCFHEMTEEIYEQIMKQEVALDEAIFLRLLGDVSQLLT